ncbi:hypothetical protein [Limnovirga soli]|uniref:Uncharacterized protein n=1 Tax=Limnovirga soli TaxID=2656915 RepID=A0A8J8JUT8_9BACT|nr:hypothetical protein [Limnovirga soli]NNV57378.1 hypothetical protein [Limnovirga soli]
MELVKYLKRSDGPEHRNTIATLVKELTPLFDKKPDKITSEFVLLSVWQFDEDNDLASSISFIEQLTLTLTYQLANEHDLPMRNQIMKQIEKLKKLQQLLTVLYGCC